LSPRAGPAGGLSALNIRRPHLAIGATAQMKLDGMTSKKYITIQLFNLIPRSTFSIFFQYFAAQKFHVNPLFFILLNISLEVN
jgi:hypothetical protein